jgi:DNA-binding response OmpR family regulator
MGSILVMDDSEIVRMALTAMLEAQGYRVRAAANLSELEAALVEPPDLFVLDVQMPEMFGDDLAQVLRHVRSMKVPIVLFSDIDDEALAERGRNAGAEAWVAKRAGMDALVAQLVRLGVRAHDPS